MVRVKSDADALGFMHEKYQQYYRGVKVENATYSVHSRAGSIESITGHVGHPKSVSVTPRITSETALKQAIVFVGAAKYMWQISQEEEGLKQRENNPYATYLPKGELVIVANGIKQEASKKGQLTLAWKFEVVHLGWTV